MNELKDRYNPPNVDTCVIDDEVLLQMNRLQPLKTYGEHCDNEITGKVETFTAAVERVYLVFEIYQRPRRG